MIHNDYVKNVENIAVYTLIVRIKNCDLCYKCLFEEHMDGMNHKDHKKKIYCFKNC